MQYFSTNSIKKLFQDYVTNEVNLKSYIFGQPFNQNGEPIFKQVYPGLLVTPLSTIASEYALTRQYEVVFYDILDEDKLNLIDVQSDCEEFALRLIKFLRNFSSDFELIGDPNISFFVDRFLDDVSGVILTVSINSNADSNECDTPNGSFVPSSITI